MAITSNNASLFHSNLQDVDTTTTSLLLQTPETPPTVITRKRSVSNLSVEEDGRRMEAFEQLSRRAVECKRFRSIEQHEELMRPSTPVDTGMTSFFNKTSKYTQENLPRSPETPKKSLDDRILPGSLPLSADTLHRSMRLSLHYHDTSLVCKEGGIVSYHKGIVPNYPKGYYCCLNAELARQEAALRVVDNSVLMEIYGPRGLLAYLEAADSAAIRQEMLELEATGHTAIVSAHHFLNTRRCTKLSRTDGYTFTKDSWIATISIYTRAPVTAPSSDMSCSPDVIMMATTPTPPPSYQIESSSVAPPPVMIQHPSPTYTTAALRASSLFRSVSADLASALPYTSLSTADDVMKQQSRPLRCNLFGTIPSADNSPFPGLTADLSTQFVPHIIAGLTPTNMANTEF